MPQSGAARATGCWGRSVLGEGGQRRLCRAWGEGSLWKSYGVETTAGQPWRSGWCWGEGLGPEVRGWGPHFAPSGTAPLSPAKQDLMRVWLSLTEDSAPSSLFPTLSEAAAALWFQA